MGAEGHDECALNGVRARELQYVGRRRCPKPLDATFYVGHEERRTCLDDVLEARMRVDAARTTRHELCANRRQDLGIGSMHVRSREMTAVLRDETQDARTLKGLRHLADHRIEQPIRGATRFGERPCRLREDAQSLFRTSGITLAPRVLALRDPSPVLHLPVVPATAMPPPQPFTRTPNAMQARLRFTGRVCASMHVLLSKRWPTCWRARQTPEYLSLQGELDLEAHFHA